MRPIKTWSYPGALLDALVDTRRAVAGVELPMPTADQRSSTELIEYTLEQLDHHLIPRAREESSPAIVVVGGSTGAGKSTVVNALLGEDLTASGVLRPTTKVPHLFHHPLDTHVLSEAAQRAKVISTEAVPRGLAIVDSPDLDSVRGENREVARTLLETADLWIFVTTAARYGDAVPWEVLRRGAERGASIAIVLNRVTANVAGQVRRELVDRLAKEQLDSLPLFVIPEDTENYGQVPRDVVGGLGRWLDGVAAVSAATIVERTMHGATESVKEWIETLAERMDDQAAAAKTIRAEVRRSAAKAESQGGHDWYRAIPTGSLSGRWEQITAEGGPLHRLRNTLWARRRSAREPREEVLAHARVDLVGALESSLTYAAAQASQSMIEALTRQDDGGPGPWLADQVDPREAREKRERHASDATRMWLDKCRQVIAAMPGGANAVAVLGEEGVEVTTASAALGVDPARTVLSVLVAPSMSTALEECRKELAAARRYCINREALDMMRPTDVASLMPDASVKLRLRRAELRGLL